LSSEGRLVAVARVGAAHGRDGSFWVEEAPGAGAGPAAASRALDEGAQLTVAGRRVRVERRAGTAERPLLRLSGIEDRAAASALRGERLLVPEAEAPLGPGEWLVDDLVGARVAGLGSVRRVLAGSSCDLLEVGGQAMLVPLVSDAIRRINPDAGVIEVDRRFLGLDHGPPERP
jgi:16S rRNA processing protein RimM